GDRPKRNHATHQQEVCNQGGKISGKILSGRRPGVQGAEVMEEDANRSVRDEIEPETKQHQLPFVQEEDKDGDGGGGKNNTVDAGTKVGTILFGGRYARPECSDYSRGWNSEREYDSSHARHSTVVQVGHGGHGNYGERDYLPTSVPSHQDTKAQVKRCKTRENNG